MNKKSLRLKLARLLSKFKDVSTDKGSLFTEGDLVVGVDVFIEDEAGEMIAAADGEYATETIIYVVKDGKIEDIKDVEVTPGVEAADEVKPEDKFSALLSDMITKIESLESRLEKMSEMKKELDLVSEKLSKVALATDGTPAKTEKFKVELSGSAAAANAALAQLRK